MACSHGVMVLAWTKDKGGNSLLHERRTTTLPVHLERMAYYSTALALGNYYRTYPGIYTAEAVQKAIMLKLLLITLMTFVFIVSKNRRAISSRPLESQYILRGRNGTCRSGRRLYISAVARGCNCVESNNLQGSRKAQCHKSKVR
jgi:hypothetical protein